MRCVWNGKIGVQKAREQVYSMVPKKDFEE